MNPKVVITSANPNVFVTLTMIKEEDSNSIHLIDTSEGIAQIDPSYEPKNLPKLVGMANVLLDEQPVGTKVTLTLSATVEEHPYKRTGYAVNTDGEVHEFN